MIHPLLKDTAIEILVSPMHSHRDKVQRVRLANQSPNADANSTSKNQLHRLQCTLTDNNLTVQLNFEHAAKDSSMSQTPTALHPLSSKQPSLQRGVYQHAPLPQHECLPAHDW
jgi:hypothetical protein